MRAYKFLRRDGTALLTGFRWPVNAWVEADGPIAWCHNGIHACRIEDLPHWIGQELWAIELDGETLFGPDAVVARRGQLLARIDAWSGGVAQEFGESCARRANALASGAPSAAERAGDAAAAAASGAVAGCAYVTAAVAGEVASGRRSGPLYQHYFLAERMRQSWWLQDRLDLQEG
ncbi:MAG: hypothetical protein JO085_00865 [Acidimicrobiia bacterium]|nr:hypothetical protein [Acidimicrobiia bacterium]